MFAFVSKQDKTNFKFLHCATSLHFSAQRETRLKGTLVTSLLNKIFFSLWSSTFKNEVCLSLKLFACLCRMSTTLCIDLMTFIGIILVIFFFCLSLTIFFLLYFNNVALCHGQFAHVPFVMVCYDVSGLDAVSLSLRSLPGLQVLDLGHNLIRVSRQR